MPPLTRKRKSDLGLTEDSLVMSSPEDSKRQKKLPVRAKDEEAPETEAATSAPVSGNLKVFTDDDDLDVAAPTTVKTAEPKAQEEEEDEEEDSDDEAPEAVSTTKVASDMKKSSQAAQKAAQKAAQEQNAAQKRKRQQRDALFKQQAEERKKAEEEAAKLVQASEPAVANEDATGPRGRQRRRADRAGVPNLLPAEFLTDSSSEDEDEDASARAGAAAARPKKRRIGTVERALALEARGPKDEVVGSTLYRVEKKVDTRVAPKARKYAKSSKELLLKRGRESATPRTGGGFFVKK